MKTKNRKLLFFANDCGRNTKFMFALVLNILYITLNAQNPNLAWVKQMGGGNHDFGSSVTTDISGNIYTTGSFEGTVDFDPGAGTFNLTSAGNADIFILKLSAAGNFIWAKHFGGTNYDQGISIVTDSNGNIYTTGIFSDTVDFDPGVGVYNLISGGTFISKLDSSGNFVWAKQFNNSRPSNISIDSNSNVLTSGIFWGTVDFNPGAGIYNLTATHNYQTFISKLDASGNFVWANLLGGTSSFFLNFSSVDGNGNVYTLGNFEGTDDFDPGVGTFNLTSAGSTDIFISKLNPSGNFIWAIQFGDINSDFGRIIHTDVNGNIYITGSFNGSIDFDPGPGTFNLTSSSGYGFILKLDSSSNLLWVKQGNLNTISSMITDESENIYTTGYYENTVDFDFGVGTYNLTSSGIYDIFISKLNNHGNFIWAKSLGGTSSDVSNCITIDGAENIYTTGYFSGTADFDPGAGTFSLTSSGASDAFVLKLSQALTTQLSSASCGATLTALDQPIYCDPVPGSTNYRFQITTPSSAVIEVYRGANINNYFLSSAAASTVGYGGTYSIKAAALVGGTWTPYGAACSVTTPTPPVTQLASGSCNTTLTALDHPIYCDPIPGSTNYRFEITTPSSAVIEVYRGANINNYFLSSAAASTVGYGGTYSIKAAALVGGTWTPYGAACSVTTPTAPVTQLASGSCNTTLTVLDQPIYCDPIPGSTNYRFEITTPSSTVIEVYRGININNYFLSSAAVASVVGYGGIYSIKAAALVGGTWTPYGAACSVTTPAPPVTQLASGSCSVTLTALNQQLLCDPVPGATNYRYEITDSGSNTQVVYRGNPFLDFYLTWGTGINYAETYSIKVAAAVGGTWTAYGPPCDVNTPASARPSGETPNLTTGIQHHPENIILETGLTLYPNPTSGQLFIEFENMHQELDVIILNNLGQTIRTGKFYSTRFIQLDLEDPKGIYFIQIYSGDTLFKPLKVIKN